MIIDRTMKKINKIYFATLLLFLPILFTGCENEDDKNSSGQTSVTEFLPTQGGYDTKVLIEGENFPIDKSRISVSINGVNIPVVRSNEEQILIEIPKNKEIGSAPIVLTIDGKTFTTATDFQYLRTRTVTTLAGTGERGYQDGPGNQAKFVFTTDWGEARRGGIDVDDNLNVYVSDAGNQCIRKITPDGTVSTVAGPGPIGITDWGINWRFENNGSGSYNAQTRPTDVKVDSKGNMYVTDDYIGGMIMFEPDGKAHYLGWGGGVNCIAIDEENNTLYLNDHNNGIIYKKAMNDYGPFPGAMEAIITGVKWSAGMVVDKRNGDLYLVHHDENKILKYARNDWSNPVVVAGSGQEGNSDGPAQSARFYYPWGIDIDASGNLYIAGNGNATADPSAKDQSIRFVDSSTGTVTTFAGSGSSGYLNGLLYVPSFAGINNSESSLSSTVKFSAPTGVAVDKNGTVYVLDRGNNVVRKIETE